MELGQVILFIPVLHIYSKVSIIYIAQNKVLFSRKKKKITREMTQVTM